MGVWFGTDAMLRVSQRGLICLQKRAARIILDVDGKTPSITHFNNLDRLPFTEQSLIKRKT